ncbi:hypothetical protein ECP03018678_3243 [Escherichia coli P0301867.8]|nr:hypothetical protein ECP03018678_3243 [Escherichia coli P0301867.8]
MKLALTLEADSINVQALNMGRIVVDVDGVNLAELINVACDNGYSLRVVDESDRTATDTPPRPADTLQTAHITEKTTPGVLAVTQTMTSANQNGFISQVAAICYVPMRGHTRFCGSSAWGCQKRSVVWLSHLPDVMASVSFIWMPALDACRVYPLSTGNQDNMKSLTTETALDILIAWLQDNIDCESGIIFDNDEDRTDSAALLPCIEQAREDIHTLRQLQFLQQNR